ncbi:LuxR C-terminal-related transcriptional regulator [Desulfothermobacter acidiphilus]|uniref:helix-turn-helix transcriptional regulator n=1 Tax=Desulfothermobacter acidiphilus TaxID=1938353 RepID=UPI003F8A8DA6
MVPFDRASGPCDEDYAAFLCPPEELEASYERCRSCNLAVDLEKPRLVLDHNALAARLAENRELLALADSIVQPICASDPQRNFLCILCEPELVTLRVYASPSIVRAAAAMGIRPGTVFTEESCGTNALVMARRLGRLVAVRGEQHYCRMFHYWWCVAAPVQGPDASVAGYLDLSLHAERELGFAVSFLQTLLWLLKKEAALPGEMVTLPPAAERRLSPREREILLLLLRRLTNEEIAAYLNLSVYTVKTYRKFIYRKLGIGSFNELLAWCRTEKTTPTD